MPRSLKVIAILLALFLSLAAIAAFLFPRLDVQSRFVETTAEATGLDVTVGGSVSIRILPTPHLALREVTFKNETSPIATLSEGDIALAFWPLLRQQVRPTKVSLRNVSLLVERDAAGHVNFATPALANQRTRLLSRMSLDRVSISGATVSYANRQLGNELKAIDCSFESDDFHLAAGEVTDIMKHLSLNGRVECAEVRSDLLAGSDVKFAAAGEKGIFELTPITMGMMGGEGTGDVHANFDRDVPAYRVRLEVTQLHVDDLLDSVAPGKVGEGFMDFAVDLSMQGFNTRELTRSARGEVSLTGKSLQFAIGDLDEKLDRYESSQHFNLVDLGAFLIAGPLGAVVTKGYNFASIFQVAEGNTEIRVLVSHWNVENGVAHAEDVAMATEENRIVVKGALDFRNGEFDDVTVAVVDNAGCVRAEQKISGPFNSPDIAEPNILASLAGPISKLIAKAGEVMGAQCDVFYEGAVPP